MSDIDWCDKTWNVTTGCSPVSPGCDNCWAARYAATRGKRLPQYKGLTEWVDGKPRWNGKVRFNKEALEKPLHWRKPRTVFVCSTGDLFHQKVTDRQIASVFSLMMVAPQHTFLVLTKRPERALEWTQSRYEGFCWPTHVWPGVTAENQRMADQRIPVVLKIPAALHFVSLEPCLGDVQLRSYLLPGDRCLSVNDSGDRCTLRTGHRGNHRALSPTGGWGKDEPQSRGCLGWVTLGGESGRYARPMNPDWARRVRDDCAEAGVPFCFKQWGEWLPFDDVESRQWPAGYLGQRCPTLWLAEDGETFPQGRPPSSDVREKRRVELMIRVGKKAAGHLLDGREHREMPRVAAEEE